MINFSMGYITLSLFVSFDDTLLGKTFDGARAGGGAASSGSSWEFNYRLVASLGNGGASNHPFHYSLSTPYAGCPALCSAAPNFKDEKNGSHSRMASTSFACCEF